MEKQKHMSLLVVYALTIVLSCLKFGCGSTVGSCIESEKQALLLLKESLTDSHNYNCLSSWIGDDCCAWYGIGCNNKTGRVMQLDLRQCSLRGDQINPSLLDLKYLTYLDLSYNTFENVQIPQFFGSFKYLAYLSLSRTDFRGLVPHHFGNLSNLRYLDLSVNFNIDYFDHGEETYQPLLSIDSMEWLSKLTLLEHLDLSCVNLSRATDWISDINMLPNSISVLDLSHCMLPNSISHHAPFINITSLTSLGLSRNHFNSSFPLWVCNNTGLAHLSLRFNKFRGPIPNAIGKLTSLINLDLAGNNFQGSIPDSIGALSSLINLDLSDNNFQGSIPDSIGALSSLTKLDLSANNLHGVIPRSIGNLTSLLSVNLGRADIIDQVPSEMGNLTKLTYLNLDFNELRGHLPETICQISTLELLGARGNQLGGSIPRCIGKLSNVEDLDLSQNSWEGFLSEHHFANLTSLSFLYISSRSNLVLNVSSNWVPPFQLKGLFLESLKVGPKFPNWLLTQTHISSFSMPNTSISHIPVDWFVSLLSQASYIDLSNNAIKDINGVDLNQFLSLLIAEDLNHMSSLYLSNNGLSGELPDFLCHLPSLSMLDLSNNNLSGSLPQCFRKMIQMGDLNVMNNSFSGAIPDFLGSMRDLAYLNLHNNKFQGTLPLSFQNLENLILLDVGKNNLSGILSPWIGEQLPYLQYLILRSNNFYGNIPTQLCHHSTIQVINLARNQLTGNIPRCFNNFKAMITSESSENLFYHADPVGEARMIIDDAEGYDQKYSSTLRFMFSIDLSYNNISGEIPEELMDLSGLLRLNLAGNHLAGRIPDRIGKLQNLEFLDLSRNELNGPIPQSLSDLNFLSRLNLSFNDLSGRIPTGKQLQTLDDPSIYAGNNQLCGRPILKPCANDTESHNGHDFSETNSDSDDERVWFFAGLGPGLLVGFLGFCGSLHFIKPWRYLYFQYVEKVFDKIALEVALLRRKLHS